MPKKRGRVPRKQPMADTHFYVPEYLLEWAKEQPETMAGLLRRLLEAEYARHH